MKTYLAALVFTVISFSVVRADACGAGGISDNQTVLAGFMVGGLGIVGLLNIGFTTFDAIMAVKNERPSRTYGIVETSLASAQGILAAGILGLLEANDASDTGARLVLGGATAWAVGLAIHGIYVATRRQEPPRVAGIGLAPQFFMDGEDLGMGFGVDGRW